ncbi:E3 ubiquitin-protein ligase RNF180 isoform X1 [Oryzias latipes]|uniref:Ring finger protein 180b n=1 Tax=Oryzias latipes TaxID=8090 RepID=H2MIZ3_ORYLA|nr:E3 ubiquitin-protein ligase RNF180 isoform X1 [Oryzias latipes]XP_011480406.1 E3 ubiquitin-protein ligase RNF180 isoform X1 [Oryzias latipes]
MLRCRKCRRAIVHSECLSKQASDDSSAAVCSVWHVNVEQLPEWILTSVHQSQWTAGRLNCHNCRARLGGFNFVNRTVCPCGLDAAVHLSKSRVDQDHRHRVLLVQPRSSRPGGGQNGLLTDSYQGDEASELRGAVPDVLQLHCVAAAPGFRPAEGALPLGDREDAQLFSFSPLYCIPHRRCSLEEDGDFGSCFCPSAPHSSSQQVRSEAVFEGALVRPAPPWQGLQRRPLESSGDEAGSELLLRRTSGFDRAAEREEEVLRQATLSPPAPTLSRREKNHLKSQKRKERRRERWLHRQLEEEEGGALHNADKAADREAMTCAVCLDIYFSPYSCHPCGHVFCEPCLRTLTKNRPANTPCPLCRTVISHTSFHQEFNQTSKTLFPKIYSSRQTSFRNSSCAKWPLPSQRKHFSGFWDYRRSATMAGRRWHFVHGGFTLEALNFHSMRRWLLDIGLVIVYVHSLNWILILLFLCILMYYFFF